MSEKVIRIYKIWSPLGDLVYYGSTSLSGTKRFNGHKSNYRAYKRDAPMRGPTSSYKVFDAYGIENCYFEILEEFRCSEFDVRRQKEGQLVRNNQNCVNKAYKVDYIS